MNIYDVAKEAGVSIATVSRYMNGKPNISQKTAQKVQAALDKFHFTPNGIARGLVLDSMKMIGIVIYDIRNAYFANTAYTIEQELNRNGYHSVVCNTGDNNMEYSIQMLAETRVDGLILVGSVFMRPSVEKTLARYHAGRPIIFISGGGEGFNLENAYKILCADDEGIKLSVRHLYDRGHRNIMYVKQGSIESEIRKLNGYKEAMEELGLGWKKDWVAETPQSIEGGKAACNQLLDRFGEQMTAIVCGEDITAVGCVLALAERGIDVPGRVAVTGYGNQIYGKLSTKVLTSVDNKHSIIGTEAARALCDRLAGVDIPSKTLIYPDLVVGNTT